MSNILSPTLTDIIIKDKCIQLDGQDHILREYMFAGPNSGRDSRLILDIQTLELLLDVARSSDTRRVTIYNAGINVKVRRTDKGELYETLHIVGSQPRPDRISNSMSIKNVPMGHAQSLVNGWKKK